MQLPEAATLDRKSGEAEGSAVRLSDLPNFPFKTPTPNRSVIPTEAYRISCQTALDKATRASFRKEGRMKCDSATKFHRKFGGAKWRDLQFNGPLMEMFFNKPKRNGSPSQTPHHQLLQHPANLLNSLTPQIIKERQGKSALCFGHCNRQIRRLPPPSIPRL
jgi:hypothetical protein